MIIIVLYDISNDKIRLKLSKYLLRIGLYRIQKSVFIGEIQAPKRKHLEQHITRLLAEEEESENSIVVVPVSEGNINALWRFGREMNMDLYLDRIQTLIL